MDAYHRKNTTLAVTASPYDWMLLPLRAFLGITFTYAGLQKLADRWFFNASAPSSLPAQLHAAARTSPIGGLVGGVAHQATLVGLLIAFGELAVGVATLTGLWARLAAAAGLLLSLGFLLTVSWHTRPYYYGADIVFVFAWTPLSIAGAGRFSVDAWSRSLARAQLRLRQPVPVTVDFAAVQRLCGHFERGRCRARGGNRCRVDGCPVLAEAPAASRSAGELDRRTLLQQAGVAGWLGAAALLGGGAVAALGRLVPPRRSTAGGTTQLSPSQTGTTNPGQATPGAPATTGPPAGQPSTPPAGSSTTTPTAGSSATTPTGTPIGSASGVPVGGAARFNDPATGDPAYALHPKAGTFLAFDAVCPHAGCTVEYTGSIFRCPCHGAQFDASTGQVLRGPARRSLTQIPIHDAADGTLYVT